MSTSFIYNDNENVIMTYVIDYDTQGTNLTDFDYTTFYKNGDYGFDTAYSNFYFSSTSNFDYTPYININFNDGTNITLNATISEQSAYNYIITFNFYNDGDTTENPILYFSYNSTKYKIDDIANIAFFCGVKSQIISSKMINTFNLIGVYGVTDDNMKALLQSDNRFQIRSYTFESTTDFEQIDLTSHIVKLYKPFFQIDFENTNVNIIINGFATNVVATEKNDIVVTYETENVKLLGFYENVLDNDCDIIIHFPFYNNYSLDSKFINHNIKFRFILDCSNNNMLIEIYIDDIVIDTINSNFGYEIPILNGQVNSTSILNSYSFNSNSSSIIIDILYKEIASNKITTNKIDTIKNYSGFIQCDFIDFNFELTENEQNELKQLLQNGIYI